VNFHEILQRDAANAEATLQLIEQLDSRFAIKRGRERPLIDLVHEILRLYEIICRDYGDSDEDIRDHEAIGEAVKGLGITDADKLEDLIAKQLPRKEPKRSLVQKAKTAHARLLGRQVRTVLLLSLPRAYVFAMTDTLRRRYSPAKGHIRWAAETLAHIALVHQDPDIGKQWVECDQVTGQAFFNRHKEAVRNVLQANNLWNSYDMASQVAVHPRMAGLVGGLKLGTDANTGVLASFGLEFQEGTNDQDRFMLLLLNVLDVLRAHERILIALPKYMPEITDPLLLQTHLPRLVADMQVQWKKLATTFPDLVKLAAKNRFAP
jgi:hypothetical protein